MAQRVVNLILLAFSSCILVTQGHDPMVAFMCNRPAMYQTANGWEKDDSTDCLTDPSDILDYCRKVYPDLDVRNIVEASDRVEINNWCDFGLTVCHHQFTVRPFRCLVGPFQSDALLVPEHCVFDHVHDTKVCTGYSDWNKTAASSCSSRGLSMQSFAMLQPCGIDRFNGVEFVCCPVNPASKPSVTTVTTTTPTTTTAAKLEIASEKPDSSADDTFARYLHEMSPVDGERHWNEHEYYAKAKSDMQKHHHDKVSKMMKEWSSARQRVQDIRSRDPDAGEKFNKEITNRFQKMYEMEESEDNVEKKQLSVLHQQRVQADLDDRKRHAMQKYIEALDEEDPDLVHILKSLTRYIKALQKDRLHTVNRYRHLRQTSPTEAESSRQGMVEHLRLVDRQLKSALSMLDRLPKYANKIQKQIQEYVDAYHTIDASITILFGPLDKTSTPVPTTSTTTPTTTTTTTTTTVAPIVDKSDEDDDGDEYEDDEEAEEPKVMPKNAEEQEFKKAMETKDKVDEDDEEDESDDESDESDDDDDDTEVTTKTTTTSTTTTTSVPAATSRSVLGRLDDGLFDDHADDIDHLDGEMMDYVHAPFSGGAGQSHGGDNMAKSPLSANQVYVQKVQTKSSESFSAVPLGIAVGCITVFVVIIAGVVVMRRRGQARRFGRHGIPAHGIPVDPAASPEERHVAAMQMTGYENPTYKYFEAATA